MLKNATCGDSCTAAVVNLLCPALSSVVLRSSKTLVILKDVFLIKQTCFLLVVHRTFLEELFSTSRAYIVVSLLDVVMMRIISSCSIKAEV